MDHRHLLPEIVALAERAGAVILEHYREGIEVRAKADASPVTIADEAAEAVILARLAELSPEIPVVAEETVAGGHVPELGDGRFWLVDPLDGTKEFVSRNGEFTVNIALVERRAPMLGVVLAPALGKVLVGGVRPWRDDPEGRPAPAIRVGAGRRSARSRRQPLHSDAGPRFSRAMAIASGSRPALAEVLPGRRGQGRPLSALRADHGVGYRRRPRGAERRRRPGHDPRRRPFPLSQAGLSQSRLHRPRRLNRSPGLASDRATEALQSSARGVFSAASGAAIDLGHAHPHAAADR